jgi:hypothetical protein
MPKTPGGLVSNVCGLPVGCQKELNNSFRKIFSFEASPDNFQVVRRKVGFMQSECGSPSDYCFMFSDGLKMTAVNEASSRRTGNKAGWASTDKLELFLTSLC